MKVDCSMGDMTDMPRSAMWCALTVIASVTTLNATSRGQWISHKDSIEGSIPSAATPSRCGRVGPSDAYSIVIFGFES